MIFWWCCCVILSLVLCAVFVLPGGMFQTTLLLKSLHGEEMQVAGLLMEAVENG